ncbi:MAG: methyltransferase domain-containing protein [Vicinamibacterales bacterium]
MKVRLLERLVCPLCAGRLSLEVERGTGDECEFGSIRCACGAEFPIERFVPSFFGPTPSEAERRMLADGEYWSRFYTYYEDLGYRYFVDSRADVAPLLFHGILETISLGRWRRFAHWHEPHYRDLFADDLLGRLAPGTRALELGCGGGWLTLELARRGGAALGQDTALEALVRAKRQAMAEGVDAEYIHASSLALPLGASSIDLFVSFQALHHFEDLPATLARVSEALAPGARVVIFEHRRSRPPRLGRIASALDGVFVPIVRRRFAPTARRDWVASPSEDCAVGIVDDSIRSAFDVVSHKDYSLLLQQLPVYVYFCGFRSPLAYVIASSAVNFLDRVTARLLPDRCEHRLYVGTRRIPGKSSPGLLSHR